MSDDIRPRIDEHGVGWCDAGCPQLWSKSYPDLNTESECHIDGKTMCDDEVCPHHASRVAAERDRLRDAIRTALDESTTYDEVEARLTGLVGED
jgi:hypothetical protein